MQNLQITQIRRVMQITGNKRMVELRVDEGVKENVKEKLVRSRLKLVLRDLDVKTDKESRCPECGGEKEAKKTDIAMGGLHDERHGQSDRGMENKTNKIENRR